MEKFLANLSGLAQVSAMAYVAYNGSAPEWLRWCLASFVALWLVLKVSASEGL